MIVAGIAKAFDRRWNLSAYARPAASRISLAIVSG
jgi:hypothetical protein